MTRSIPLPRPEPTRRSVLVGALGCLAGGSPRLARAVEDFSGFLAGLWPAAQAAGVTRGTFEQTTAGLTLDRALGAASTHQAEFDKPLQTYYREAVTAGRIAEGRNLATSYANALDGIENRFGVPREICLAAWGMESAFGRSQGQRDVPRTLASLAYLRRDRPTFRDEFIAALVMIEKGVSRARLKGSWAGAMGGPQFLPSVYLKYAVSLAGTGAPDIWDNPGDSLASIANFLRGEGWAAGEPWIEDVTLPQDFDIPTLHASADGWSALGLRRPDGRAPAGGGEAALFLPSGAAGPAFLLFPNYFVIKQYNNSDSYALALGSLARRIAGAPPLAAAWPTKPVNLSRADKLLVQTKLAALGLYDGPRDGKFGPKARDAIHAYQRRVGIKPADGFATPDLVRRLQRGA